MALNFESVGTPLCIIANENKDKKSKNANPIICVAETENNISKPFQTMSLKEEGQSYQLIPNPSIERQILYVTGSSGSGKSYFTKKYCREFAKIFPKRPIYLISSIDDDTSVDDIKGLKRFKIKGDTFINDTFEIKDFKDSLVIFDDVDCITDKKLRTKVMGILNMVLETGRHENVYCIYTSHLATAGNDTKRILNECNSITFFPKTMGGRMLKYLAEGYLGLDKSEIKKLKSITSRAVTVVKSYPKTIVGDKDVFILSALDDK